MNCNEANIIPIDVFLSHLGIEPVHTRRHVKWYRSPFRNERTASFALDTRINKWYDFGIGEGGDLVNLGTRMSNSSVSEFLSQLSRNDLPVTVHQPVPTELVSEWKILKVKPIAHPALIAYLTHRCVPLSLANKFCSEVHYANDKLKYFAIGFRNDADGYEVRNSIFKGCIGKKDITTIHKEGNEVRLFEGFMDFLSSLELYGKQSPCSFIILNSITQLPKAIRRLEAIAPVKIESYFNNDEGGISCTQSLIEKFPHAQDKSPDYKPFNDLNDALRSKRNAVQISM